MTDIPLSLDVSQPFPSSQASDYPSNRPASPNSNSYGSANKESSGGRKRSNSQSQVISMPNSASSTISAAPGSNSTSTSSSSSLARQRENPRKRNQVQYYVTLVPLNETFTKKHLPVATFPETTKLGRPTGTKHKPDVANGYFDSRVLSRNHAQIYIDPNNGKLMLQDLGSSNGTYLNDLRLTHDPVEIKMGDVVCLGFNVQAESTHKQISLKIDNISVIPNSSNSGAGYIKNSDLHTTNLFLNRNEAMDTPEFKHLTFIEDIFRQVTTNEKNRKSSKNHKRAPEDLTFDNALFGDINPNVEGNLLGLYSSTNSGIYNNSQITNTTTLESIVNILVSSLARVKQQNNTLNTLEQFFTNYSSRLNEINSQYLEQQFKKSLSSIQNDLKKEKQSHQKLKERHKLFEEESTRKIDTVQKKFKSAEKEREILNKTVQDYIKKQEYLNEVVEKERATVRELEAQRERERQERNREQQEAKQKILDLQAKFTAAKKQSSHEYKTSSTSSFADDILIANDTDDENSGEENISGLSNNTEELRNGSSPREKEFAFLNSRALISNSDVNNSAARSRTPDLNSAQSEQDSLQDFLLENAKPMIVIHSNGIGSRELVMNGSASSTGFSNGSVRNSILSHTSELTPPISDSEDVNGNVNNLNNSLNNNVHRLAPQEGAGEPLENTSETETVISSDDSLQIKGTSSSNEEREKERLATEAKNRTHTIVIAVSAMLLGYMIRRVTN
ncbi:uncharacterized protein RJT20DRAFT_128115 [Scheffersomyces xylosifermentans]|uniref:uncharacterized protein n=1 Tax=Scheffersomyces xylosifermentans TaxID=1304137 RepID=UPI00315DDE14